MRAIGLTRVRCSTCPACDALPTLELLDGFARLLASYSRRFAAFPSPFINTISGTNAVAANHNMPRQYIGESPYSRRNRHRRVERRRRERLGWRPAVSVAPTVAERHHRAAPPPGRLRARGMTVDPLAESGKASSAPTIPASPALHLTPSHLRRWWTMTLLQCLRTPRWISATSTRSIGGRRIR